MATGGPREWLLPVCYVLGILLIARSGLRTRIVRMAERLRFSVSTPYSTALQVKVRPKWDTRINAMFYLWGYVEAVMLLERGRRLQCHRTCTSKTEINRTNRTKAYEGWRTWMPHSHMLKQNTSLSGSMAKMGTKYIWFYEYLMHQNWKKMKKTVQLILSSTIIKLIFCKTSLLKTYYTSSSNTTQCIVW